ncbi:MAG: NUDIX hydrolase [Gammaproteobacteria bacterium]|nr:NUDIX hydrolase [Gammaproteobacteria bacterium]
MPRPETPALTVDIVIEMHDRPDRPIVLIERKYPPIGWALPGGFVDVGETVSVAAVREAKEETCLDVTLDVLLGCYSDPARDRRGHTVSLVYTAHATGEPRAADDAANVLLLDPCDEAALAGIEVTFDHRRILADYCHYRHTGEIRLPD